MIISLIIVGLCTVIAGIVFLMSSMNKILSEILKNVNPYGGSVLDYIPKLKRPVVIASILLIAGFILQILGNML